MVSNLDYPSGRIRGYIAESGRNICSIDQVSKAGNYFNCITGYQANFGSSGSYNILFFYEPAGVSTLPTSLKTFYNAAGKASRKDINGQWFCAGSVSVFRNRNRFILAIANRLRLAHQ